MRMKTPELPALVGSGTWNTTRRTELLSFSFVYQSRPMPPSVLSTPSSITKRPGPTCCQPSRFLPLKSGCHSPESFALELMAASPASATTQPRRSDRRNIFDSFAERMDSRQDAKTAKDRIFGTSEFFLASLRLGERSSGIRLTAPL